MKKTKMERGRPKKDEPTKVVALRLPESLVERLTEEAGKTGLPLATYCKMVLSKERA